MGSGVSVGRDTHGVGGGPRAGENRSQGVDEVPKVWGLKVWQILDKHWLVISSTLTCSLQCYEKLEPRRTDGDLSTSCTYRDVTV